MPSINDLHRVLDAALDAVVVFDHEGRIQFTNKATGRLFGWSTSELAGLGIDGLLPGVDHLLGQGADINQEAQALHRDGTVVPVRLAIGRVAGASTPRHVAFLHDLSGRKQEEERTRLMNDRLMNVARLATIGEMAGGIAHELNQPLTAIANYALAAERLLESPGSDLEDVHVALREIVAEAMRAGEIIRRLRSLARADHGAPSEVTSVEEFIEELRSICQADARAHRARLSIDVEPGLPPLLMHRMQIAQVLLNLLRNALEAMEEEPAESRQVSITCRRTPEGDCEIAVRDNGPGVSGPILERLFEPFRSSKANGVGLGLPMCRTIAEAHGGALRHEPVSPRGARFVLTLPAAKVNA